MKVSNYKIKKGKYDIKDKSKMHMQITNINKNVIIITYKHRFHTNKKQTT